MRLKVKVLSLDNGEQTDAGIFPVYNNHICDEQTPVFANKRVTLLDDYVFLFSDADANTSEASSYGSPH
ncbi:unnamed protein product [Arabis nemorensis]|uniref:Uncharacterized protein n=1 Tax=Arabis nemorensis TaxID=586526 RepID=A0A565CWG8_9BRAS|nr:unnamed protein product [Arabis nemorensis]